MNVAFSIDIKKKTECACYNVSLPSLALHSLNLAFLALNILIRRVEALSTYMYNTSRCAYDLRQ